MKRLEDAITAWEGGRLSIAKVNGRFLIDAQAIEIISEIATQELKHAGIHIPDAEKDTIRPLLSLLLIDERDPRRGLVGNMSVDISSINVAGAVIAAAGIIAWALGDGHILSAENTIAVSAAAQAAAAAVSSLSLDERLIIETVLSLKHFRILSIVTLGDVVKAVSDSRLTPIAITGLLTQLRNKGAVSWSGTEDSPIEVIKWF